MGVHFIQTDYQSSDTLNITQQSCGERQSLSLFQPSGTLLLLKRQKNSLASYILKVSLSNCSHWGKHLISTLEIFSFFESLLPSISKCIHAMLHFVQMLKLCSQKKYAKMATKDCPGTDGLHEWIVITGYALCIQSIGRIYLVAF